MAEVTVSGIFKRFGSVAALQEIDLTVHDNEFVVLVGPSGSGKSTLLRIIAGLERQSEGSVAIDGRDMAGIAPKDRDVAMVFQSHALYPHMNVFDNLAFNQRIRGVDRKTVDRKVREVAERLEITELLKRRPRQMSGGQRQRVAHRPGAGAGSAHLPLRRAALQPRCRAAGAAAHGDQAAAPGDAAHIRLRHPRPG